MTKMTNILLALGFIALSIVACNIGMGDRVERGYAMQLRQNR